MALAKDSNREVLSLILTKEQARRLRAIATLRTTEYQRVSLSDVAREIVALGLDSISGERNIGIGATVHQSTEEEAAA